MMDEKEFKKYCNNLRCPICQSQLDGNIHKNKAALYCVRSNTEYNCTIFSNEISYNVEYIKIQFPISEYFISSHWLHNSNKANTIIYKVKADLEYKYRYTIDNLKEIVNIPVRINSILSLKEEKVFLHKIKLYNTLS